jgi:hypothetical protein
MGGQRKKVGGYLSAHIWKLHKMIMYVLLQQRDNEVGYTRGKDDVLEEEYSSTEKRKFH